MKYFLTLMLLTLSLSPLQGQTNVIVIDGYSLDVVFDYEVWKRGDTNANRISSILQQNEIHSVPILAYPNWNGIETEINLNNADIVMIHEKIFYDPELSRGRQNDMLLNTLTDIDELCRDGRNIKVILYGSEDECITTIRRHNEFDANSCRIVTRLNRTFNCLTNNIYLMGIGSLLPNANLDHSYIVNAVRYVANRN